MKDKNLMCLEIYTILEGISEEVLINNHQKKKYSTLFSLFSSITESTQASDDWPRALIRKQLAIQKCHLWTKGPTDKPADQLTNWPTNQHSDVKSWVSLMKNGKTLIASKVLLHMHTVECSVLQRVYEYFPRFRISFCSWKWTFTSKRVLLRTGILGCE